VHGRRTGEDDPERLRVRGGDRPDVQRTHPLRQDGGTGERLLHRDLLVQHHSDQQRVRIGGQQQVGVVAAGEVKASVRHRASLAHWRGSRHLGPATTLGA